MGILSTPLARDYRIRSVLARSLAISLIVAPSLGSAQSLDNSLDSLQKFAGSQEPAPLCLPGGHEQFLAEKVALASPLPNDNPSEQRPRSVEEADKVAANGDLIKEITLKNFLIDDIYPSMYGPWNRHYVKLFPSNEEPYVWITGYRAEVLDSNTGTASQEFMCHTNLDLAGVPGNPYRYVKSQLSISQGQQAIMLPPGFGLRIPNGPDNMIDVNGMVLNNNYPNMHKYLDFRASIHYVGESTARSRRLVALRQASVFNTCRTNPGPGQTAWMAGSTDTECERASKTSEYAGDITGHWIVYPGRHVYKSDVTSQLGLDDDTLIHYMWVHVHPFAESIELIDETTKTTVWRANIENNPYKAVVTDTEH